MAAATTTTSCPISVWTEVATAVNNVTMEAVPRQNYQVYAGASAPSLTTAGISAYAPGLLFTLADLGSTNVYVMPAAAVAVAVTVISS